MGLLVWTLTTLSLYACATLVVHRSWRERSSLERAALSLTLGLISQIAVMLLLGHARVLYRPAIVLLTAAACAAALRWLGQEGIAASWASLRADVRAGARALAPRALLREPMLLVVPVAFFVLGLALVCIWALNSWDWHGAVYHLPIAFHIQQNHGIGWIDTHSVWVKGYPFNSSLLIAWNTLLMHTNQLDDATQVIPALIVALTAAAWARRLGASGPLALSAGLCFFAAPAVIVQLPHSQNDITCAALFMVTLYLCAFEGERRDRLLAFSALGAYAGTKYSGVVQTLFLLALWVLPRTFWSPLKGLAGVARRRVAFRQVLSESWTSLRSLLLPALLYAFFGAYKYIENLVRTGDPTYPFHLNLPFGIHFAGVMDPGPFYFAPQGSTGMFFGAPGDLGRLFESWYETNPVLWPDVRMGGFGPFFAYVGLPMLVLGLGLLAGRRRWSWLAPVLLGVACTLVLPAAWWARYTLAVYALALVCMAYCLAYLDSVRSWLGIVPRIAAVVMAVYAVGKVVSASWENRLYYGWPHHLPLALREGALERSARQVTSWLWPAELHLRRARELEAGDLVTYDNCGDFLSELWDHRFETSVGFIDSTDPRRFASQVRELGPRWVAVNAGSQADTILATVGCEAIGLFRPSCRLYDVKPENLARLDKVLGRNRDQ